MTCHCGDRWLNWLKQGSSKLAILYPGGVLPDMAYKGCATGHSMVFGLSVLDRVYNCTLVCPKQGMVAQPSSLNMAYTVFTVFTNPRLEMFPSV